MTARLNLKVLLCILFGVFSWSTVIAADGEMINSGLVAYYSFDDGTAKDNSDNEYNGKVFGDPDAVSGVSGTALRFDGIDDYIEIADTPALNPNQITISFWANPAGISKPVPTVKHYMLVNKELQYEIALFGHSFDGASESELAFAFNPNWYWYGADYFVELNRFIHVAVTFDENNVATAFVNGVKTRQIDYSRTVAPTPSCLRIAARGCNAYYNYVPFAFFEGIIDEVRIYNRSLSTEEIQSLYEANNNQLSEISGTIISPKENTALGPSTFVISATASTRAGADVKRVEFYALFDGTWHSAGIDNSSPYQVVWQTPNALRSQQLNFGIHVVDTENNILEYADIVHGISYVESLGNPDVDENWNPTRAYLNQRSLQPGGDSKCSVASMAMMLASNGLVDMDYANLSSKANDMYPDVLNANGDATVLNMVAELEDQGLEAESSGFVSTDAAWNTLVQEIDDGRPVIVRTQHGVVTQYGHFFVAVGYRNAAGVRQVITYDPYGQWLGSCCTNGYDRNTREEDSHNGQWASYDFDLAFGRSNIIITGTPSSSSAALASSSAIPATPPDLIEESPPNIGTYSGVFSVAEEKVFIPFVTSR